MRVRRVFASGGGGEAKDAAGIGVLVCQTRFHQPVKNAIERYTIQRRRPKCRFNIVMCHRPGCRLQQLQYTNPRGRRTGTTTTNLVTHLRTARSDFGSNGMESGFGHGRPFKHNTVADAILLH